MDGIYVASRASLPARSAMWREFRKAGYPIISSWIDEAGEGQTDDLEELWQRISTEVAGCCGLVFYAETDDLPLKGALIEVGMAIALGKKVYTAMPGVDLEFRSMRPVGSWLHHPLVTKCGSAKEALDMAHSRLPKRDGAEGGTAQGSGDCLCSSRTCHLNHPHRNQFVAPPAPSVVAESGLREWTPVDSLPPAGKNVAILIEDANVYIHGWATAGYFHSCEGGWWHGVPGDYRSCRDQRWTVTHWAYLPEIASQRENVHV